MIVNNPAAYGFLFGIGFFFAMGLFALVFVFIGEVIIYSGRRKKERRLDRMLRDRLKG